MATLDAEDDVRITVRHPNRNSNRQIRYRQCRMWSWWCMCVPSKVTKQCPAIPEVWGHCPQCPVATLDAEDDVHTT
eukprot:7328224-Prymnesium_polylepis.1